MSPIKYLFLFIIHGKIYIIFTIFEVRNATSDKKDKEMEMGKHRAKDKARASSNCVWNLGQEWKERKFL